MKHLCSHILLPIFIHTLVYVNLVKVLKKTGAETRYHERFVWLDMKAETFNW